MAQRPLGSSLTRSPLKVATPLELRARYGDASSENVLVRGDNLEVLARLAPRFDGLFRCAYLDPPFNTGRSFLEYKDKRSPEAWRTMMRGRLALLPRLVRDDGAVVAEIDDTELGTLLDLLDEAFGRDNRVSIVTVVRSAPTGHKAKNRGPINVTDYLLVYAKDRRAFRPHPLYRRREGRDPAYTLYLENPDDAREAWRFSPFSRAVAQSLGYAGKRAATRALGAEMFERAATRFALDHAKRVARFAQPRYEAVSAEARKMIDRSREDPSRIFVLERAGHSPLLLRAGNRLLFLAHKVHRVDGVRVLAEPLTNVWNDVPFQGIAREGGVTFSRNKKPELLLERILALTTSPGDWVLDPFLGSGTTAAVAHKTGRRYVGIEAGTTFDDLCVPRLRRVVDGEDPFGVTEKVGWRGGGGFSCVECT